MSRLVILVDKQDLSWGAVMFVPGRYDREFALAQVRDIFVEPMILDELDVAGSPFPDYEPFVPKSRYAPSPVGNLDLTAS